VQKNILLGPLSYLLSGLNNPNARIYRDMVLESVRDTAVRKHDDVHDIPKGVVAQLLWWIVAAGHVSCIGYNHGLNHTANKE
jgi:hypothetical protein